MRVVQIISGDLWAGAEAMAYQLLCGLAKEQDIDLFVLLLNHGKLSQSCCDAGINTCVVDERKHASASILLKSIQVIRAIQPDIIHAHRYKENIIAAIIQPFCGWPKLVSTQHGRAETHGRPSSLKRLKNVVNHAGLKWRFNAVVAVSNDTRSYLSTKCDLNGKKITTISNGIDTRQYRVQSKTLQNGKFRIASAGRLFPVKNFILMVDIANQVCKQRDSVEFVLAGDGPERKAVLDKIRIYGIKNRFRMLGNVSDMGSFYRDIDIYINTSLHEGTPMTILEAMACGKPVLTFRQAGLKEIITDGYDGYTIPPGDTELFASKILQMTDQPHMITEMGCRARDTIIDRYATGKMVSGYATLYRQMVASKA
jgi:glycosyltransferase involved in cell wall biosynthesis